jgi:hypothetical protein
MPSKKDKKHGCKKLYGSRLEVWNGTAYKTTGKLTKKNIFRNKNGRLVSKNKHFTALKEKRLLKYGYGFQKGKFGYVKLSSSSKSRKRKSMKGGVGNGPIGFNGNSVSSNHFNTVPTNVTNLSNSTTIDTY